MYIGVVGTSVAGKSTAASILEEHGYDVVSLSDLLREKLNSRKLAVNEDTLYAVGNEIRTKFGPAAIMEEAINNASGDTVFDCIHGLAELRWLQDKGAIVLGIDADPRNRYERAVGRVERGRHENPGSLQAFLEQEVEAQARDRFRCDPSELLERADLIIKNNGSVDDLREQIGAWLATLDGHASGNE